MRRYPPSTIYRYLDLPYTQRIRTHNSHRHNTTPPFQTLVESPYPLPTYTTATQTHVQHSPCSHRIGKAQPQSSHPLAPTPPEPNIYTSHTLLSFHAPHSSLPSTPAAQDTISEPRVPHICPALTATTPPPPRRPHDTTQGHRPSSKSEINLIILQVNINENRKQTRGAQTAYSRHTCRHHHNSGNQAHP